MRRLFATAVSVMALTAAANAADMYGVPGGPGYKDGPPVAFWEGFYVGVNGGVGWNAGDVGNNIVDVNSSPAAVTIVPVSAPEPWGGFGGGQIGYNLQRGWAVFGVEADFQGSDIRDSTQSAFPGATSPGLTTPLSITSAYSLDYFGTVRGRLGYAFANVLLYATGGLAYGHVSYDSEASLTTTGAHQFSLAKNGFDAGYAAGAGVEHKFSSAWSAKVEYQYIDLGTDTVSAGYSTYTNTVKIDNDVHTLRFGLNYHFLPGYEPLK